MQQKNPRRSYPFDRYWYLVWNIWNHVGKFRFVDSQQANKLQYQGLYGFVCHQRIFYFAFLALSIVKATTISNGVVDDYALRKTLIVIHFIIGIAQEVLLITSIIYACKAICFTPVAIENTYFLKPIINKNGEEIFKLVPAEIKIESEQLRHDQTKHAILENCENGIIRDGIIESSSITKNSALIRL